MECGIYRIQNILNGKHYIGSSKNIKERVRKHFQLLKSNKHHSFHLQNSYNKYGSQYFVFGIIEFCDQEDLLIREQYYLDHINPKKKLNISVIANGSTYDIHTHPNKEEILAKISVASKGKNNKPFFIKKDRYETLKDAAIAFGVDVKTISYRLKNWKWKDYYYIDIPKNDIYNINKHSIYFFNDKKENRKEHIKLRYYCKCGNIKQKKSKNCIECAKEKSIVKRNIIVGGIMYPSLSEASKETQLSKQTILWRVNTNTLKFKDYYYADTPKTLNELINHIDIQNKIYEKRNNNREIIIDSIKYFSVGVASKLLNIHPSTIRKRINSKNFNGYYYL